MVRSQTLAVLDLDARRLEPRGWNFHRCDVNVVKMLFGWCVSPRSAFVHVQGYGGEQDHVASYIYIPTWCLGVSPGQTTSMTV